MGPPKTNSGLGAFSRRYGNSFSCVQKTVHAPLSYMYSIARGPVNTSILEFEKINYATQSGQTKCTASTLTGYLHVYVMEIVHFNQLLFIGKWRISQITWP